MLINELITDMIAYCCTYETFDLIFNSHGLDVINQKYGHYNGYFELFQFGLVLYHAFANFEPNYDHIVEMVGEYLTINILVVIYIIMIYYMVL